jgi:hypothetical protein
MGNATMLICVYPLIVRQAPTRLKGGFVDLYESVKVMNNLAEHHDELIDNITGIAGLFAEHDPSKLPSHLGPFGLDFLVDAVRIMFDRLSPLEVASRAAGQDGSWLLVMEYMHKYALSFLKHISRIRALEKRSAWDPPPIARLSDQLDYAEGDIPVSEYVHVLLVDINDVIER